MDSGSKYPRYASLDEWAKAARPQLKRNNHLFHFFEEGNRIREQEAARRMNATDAFFDHFRKSNAAEQS